MDKGINTDHSVAELRRKAGIIVGALPVAPGDKDAQRLLHDLQAHKVELEMQNAELAKARDDLEAALESYTDLYDFAPVGYFTLDRDGTINKVNLTGAKLLGIERDLLIGRRFGQFIAHESGSSFNTFLRNVAKKQIKDSCEVNLVRNAHDPFYARIEATACSSGEDCRIVVIDITERKLMEMALRQTKEDWERTFNAVPDLIAIIDNEHRIVRVNSAMANQLGLTPEACIGQRCYAAVHGTTEPPAFCPHSQLLGDGGEHTADVCEASLGGTHIVTVSPLLDPVGKLAGSVHVAHNISKRKQAEEAFRVSEANYRLLFDNANDMIFILDTQGRFLGANQRTVELLGYTHEELMAMTVYQVNSPAAAKLVPQRIAKLMDQGQLTFESEKRHKNGSLIPIEVSARRIMWGGHPAVFSICRDITERKIANQSHSTAMVEMVNIIAHQWRQPLATLGMIVQLTHSEGTMHGLTLENLDMFKANAMRQIRYMSNTIDEFRDFYFVEKSKRPFSPTSCISDAVRLLEPQFTNSGISVNISCQGCDGLLVNGFANEFKQVILNLLGNARDAILERRKTAGEPKEGGIGIQLTTREDSDMTIDICDNGCGIPADVVQRIFDPLFSTKKESGGTGVGLYMSRMIVEYSLEGRLSLIQDHPGAIFRINLPLEKKS